MSWKGAPLNWKGNRKCNERKRTATTIERGSEARKTREGKVTVNYKIHKERKTWQKYKPTTKTPEGAVIC